MRVELAPGLERDGVQPPLGVGQLDALPDLEDAAAVVRTRTWDCAAAGCSASVMGAQSRWPPTPPPDTLPERRRLDLVAALATGRPAEEAAAERALDLDEVAAAQAQGGAAGPGRPAHDVDGVDRRPPGRLGGGAAPAGRRLARDDDPQRGDAVTARQLTLLGLGGQAAPSGPPRCAPRRAVRAGRSSRVRLVVGCLVAMMPPSGPRVGPCAPR